MVWLESPSNGPEFARFRYCMKEIRLPEVGLSKYKKSNLDLSKGKLVFSPIYVLILFKDLFGIKISLVQIRKVILRLGLGEKRREEGKRAKHQQFVKNDKVLRVEFIGGGPYQGM